MPGEDRHVLVNHVADTEKQVVDEPEGSYPVFVVQLVEFAENVLRAADPDLDVRVGTPGGAAEGAVVGAAAAADDICLLVSVEGCGREPVGSTAGREAPV